jgi:hypothetical protein
LVKLRPKAKKNGKRMKPKIRAMDGPAISQPERFETVNLEAMTCVL